MKTVSRIHNQSIGLWSFLWSSLQTPNKKSITHRSHVVPAFWRLFFWWHAWLGHDNAPNRATFFVQKKGSVRHRLSDSNQPTVQALEPLQWSQKAMFFVQNKGFHSALPFQTYSTCFLKGPKTLIYIQKLINQKIHWQKIVVQVLHTTWTVKFVLHLVLSSLFLSIKWSTTKFLPSLNPPFLIGIPFYR